MVVVGILEIRETLERFKVGSDDVLSASILKICSFCRSDFFFGMQ